MANKSVLIDEMSELRLVSDEEGRFVGFRYGTQSRKNISKSAAKRHRRALAKAGKPKASAIVRKYVGKI